MRYAAWCAVLVWMSTGAALAQEKKLSAAERAEFSRLQATAKASFEVSDYERALKEYSAAYVLYPNPDLLYNIGQCQRYLKRYADAEKSLVQLIDKSSNAPLREAASSLLVLVRKEAAEAATMPVLPGPVPVDGTPDPEPAPDNNTDPVSAGTQPAPIPRPPRDQARRGPPLGGKLAFGGAGAALVLGGTLGVLAQRRLDAAEAADEGSPFLFGATRADLTQEAKRLALFSDLSLGAAVVGAVAGGLLWRAERRAVVAVLPGAAPLQFAVTF